MIDKLLYLAVFALPIITIWHAWNNGHEFIVPVLCCVLIGLWAFAGIKERAINLLLGLWNIAALIVAFIRLWHLEH